MIDKTSLAVEIREAANTYLANIQEMSEEEVNDNMRYFAQKAKDVAERIMESYIFSVVDKFTEGFDKISDSEIYGRFVDFNTGYQQQMLNWIQTHHLEVKEEHFDLPKSPSVNDIKPDYSPEIILGGGTFVAVGLFIFTNFWIAVAAEIIAIIVAKLRKNAINKHRIEKLETENKLYLAKIEAKKDELVNGMINELDQWLDKGVVASNDILITFGL